MQFYELLEIEGEEETILEIAQDFLKNIILKNYRLKDFLKLK